MFNKRIVADFPKRLRQGDQCPFCEFGTLQLKRQVGGTFLECDNESSHFRRVTPEELRQWRKQAKHRN
ncbi:MAG: hypothetical protein HY397_00515 [Candidatus Doudnabacteria bacterium]|nr:hypothetical protein [Candidatus Doudnabacteria bacterium]